MRGRSSEWKRQAVWGGSVASLPHWNCFSSPLLLGETGVKISFLSIYPEHPSDQANPPKSLFYFLCFQKPKWLPVTCLIKFPSLALAQIPGIQPFLACSVSFLIACSPDAFLLPTQVEFLPSLHLSWSSAQWNIGTHFLHQVSFSALS